MGERGSASTRVCVLTPDGRGALSVLRVWGPAAVAIADAEFRPIRGGSLAESPPGRLRLGRMGAGLGDEVVASVVAGDPAEVEIHCHGGVAALDLVIRALVGRGAERRQAAAWVRHAAASAIEAEALVDLARAPTARTAEILLEQARGALAGEIRRLVAQIPEDLPGAVGDLESLRSRSVVGLRLVNGWRIVLAGRPNVGKSRLLNALAGFGRAIVDATPGTTRDVVNVRTAVDGWPVEFVDTAGLRESDDPIEAAGVGLARSQQAGADLLLVVLDRSRPPTEDDRALIASAGRRPGSSLIVANKSDLPADSAWEPHGPEVPSISAERGDGIEALVAILARRLVPAPPPPGAGVPFRPAQVRRLDRSAEALRQGEIDPALRHLDALLNERTRRGEQADL